MAADLRYKFQLMDRITGKAIITAGGVVLVTAPDDPAKATLLQKDGSSQANAMSLTRGGAEFYTDAAIDDVDLFIQCPGGQFVVAENMKPGESEVWIDLNQKHQCMVIPFAQGDFTAAVETQSGFTEPANALFLPNPALRITAIDATETIDVGSDADPNGFLALASIAVLGLVKGTLVSTGQTLGALLSADESGAGVLVPEGYLSTEDEITYTTTAGSDTGEGYIYLPYVLIN